MRSVLGETENGCRRPVKKGREASAREYISLHSMDLQFFRFIEHKGAFPFDGQNAQHDQGRCIAVWIRVTGNASVGPYPWFKFWKPLFVLPHDDTGHSVRSIVRRFSYEFSQ